MIAGPHARGLARACAFGRLMDSTRRRDGRHDSRWGTLASSSVVVVFTRAAALKLFSGIYRRLKMMCGSFERYNAVKKKKKCSFSCHNFTSNFLQQLLHNDFLKQCIKFNTNVFIEIIAFVMIFRGCFFFVSIIFFAFSSKNARLYNLCHARCVER